MRCPGLSERVVRWQGGTLMSEYEVEILKIKVNHEAESTLGNVMGARHYFKEGARIDPRFLVFEYMFNLLLRDRQVEMVESFMQRARRNLSSCQQMIMGYGKTTVVGPLLALCLADGHSLVTQSMPAPLLEMSRNVLRGIFGSVTLLLARRARCLMSGTDVACVGCQVHHPEAHLHAVLRPVHVQRRRRGPGGGAQHR